MKAPLLIAVLLMTSIAVFAQSFDRNDGGKRGHGRFDNNGNHFGRIERTPDNNSYHSNYQRDNFNQSREKRDESRYVMNNEVRRSYERPVRADYGYSRHDWGHGERDDHFRGEWRRPVLDVHRRYQPEPLEIRRSRYPLFAPLHAQIIWTNAMYRDFRIFYPEISYWRYPIGFRISCISAYDSRNYIGEVVNIYGKVMETYYNPESDEYYLYLGDRFPYQDVSVVIPGYEARRFSSDPEYYFANANISVTGYVVNADGRPEIQVRRASQVSIY